MAKTNTPEIAIEIKYNDAKIAQDFQKTTSKIENSARIHEQKMQQIKDKELQKRLSLQQSASAKAEIEEQKHLAKIRRMQEVELEKQRMAMERHQQKIEKSQSSWSAKMLSQAKQIKGMLAGALAAMGLSFGIDAIKGALEYADSVGDVADAYGITTKEVQLLNAQMRSGGVLSEKQEKVYSFLAVALENMSDKSSKSTKALEKMGITSKDNVFTAFQKMKQGVDDGRVSIGDMETALGKLGKSLFANINDMQTISTINSNISNNFISDQDIKNADEFNKRMEDLKIFFQSKLAKAFAEDIKEGSRAFDELKKSIDSIDWKQLVNDLGYVVTTLAKVLSKFIEANKWFFGNLSAKQINLQLKEQWENDFDAQSSKVPFEEYEGFLRQKNRELKKQLDEYAQTLYTFSLYGNINPLAPKLKADGTDFGNTKQMQMLDNNLMGYIFNNRYSPSPSIGKSTKDISVKSETDEYKKQLVLIEKQRDIAKQMIPIIEKEIDRHKDDLVVLTKLKDIKDQYVKQAYGEQEQSAYSKGLDDINKIVQSTKEQQEVAQQMIPILEFMITQYTDNVVLAEKLKDKLKEARDIVSGKKEKTFIDNVNDGIKKYIQDIDEVNNSIKYLEEEIRNMPEGRVKIVAQIEMNKLVEKRKSMSETLKGLLGSVDPNALKDVFKTLKLPEPTEINFADQLLNNYGKTKETIVNSIASIKDKILTIKDSPELVKVLTDALKELESQLYKVPEVPLLEKIFGTPSQSFSNFAQGITEIYNQVSPIYNESMNIMNAIAEQESVMHNNRIMALQKELELTQQKYNLELQSLEEAGLKETIFYKKKQKEQIAAEKLKQIAIQKEQASAWESDKQARIAGTIMATAEGIMRAWGSGPITGAILSALIATQGVIQLATIQSQTNPYKMAKGGVVGGSGYGDTQPAMLTPGEFVVSKQYAQSNYDLLSAMNTGKKVGGDVVIHFNGTMVANDNYVRDSLIPEIKRAVRSGYSIN